MNTNFNRSTCRALTLMLLTTCTVMSISPVKAVQPPFGTETISSEYSPRIHPTKNIWDFHEAVDYNPGVGSTDLNTPIIAVESGTVDRIFYSLSGGWVISFINGSRTWRYLHLFSDMQPTPGNNVIAGNFEIGITTDSVPFIIRNAFGGFPEKAFCAVGGRIARPGLITTSQINDREPLGPIGNSGDGDGVHLHMDVSISPSDRKINPLLVLDHEPTNITREFVSPTHAQILPADRLAAFPFKIRVNSTAGKDLNHVTLKIDGQPVGGSAPTFSYAGLPSESARINTNGPSNNDTVTGVDPVQGTFEDIFVYVANLTSLSDGSHNLTATTEDIEGNASDTSVTFPIADPHFTVEREKLIFSKPAHKSC